MAARLDARDACGARAEAERLQADTIAAINAGRVPTPYQEELGAAVSSLVASIACEPATTPATKDDAGPEGKAKGRHKGKGKK